MYDDYCVHQRWEDIAEMINTDITVKERIAETF
jgi:hypothetical protein